MAISHIYSFPWSRIAISQTTDILVVKNGILLLTSSGQELLLTSSGQEWQFDIATDI